MSLVQQTQDGLDWSAITEAFAQQKRSRLPITLQRLDADGVRRAHDAIDELFALEESGVSLILGGISDIGPLAIRAAKGEVLGQEELREAGRCLRDLDLTSRTLAKHGENAPTLAELGSGILLDGWVVEDLDGAFDASGQLSPRRFPQIAALKNQITSLQGEVRTTLDGLLRSQKLGDLLQDSYYTTRNDRFVLPIKAHAKRWDLGIVHGTSGSGATAYIEPHEVIVLNNRIKVAEGELEAEIRRILAGLSRELGSIADDVVRALDTAIELDLTAARLGLARALDATRPVVGRTGTIRLLNARHPVLALRGVTVVPNSVTLQAEQPALILTGPNTGGKTVALKAVGLCALLVAHGCFVPALEGSRVDLFDGVLASIGDQQTVHEDLSSFSAHLKTLGEMVGAAAPHTLLLLDEIGSGTDPTQGAALATAIVEELVEAGARLVITTHFAELKALGTVDDRFGVASMQYHDGRPTYVLVPDTTGESHAFATALRMGMPSGIVERARTHMGTTARRMTETLEELEALKTGLDAERARVAALSAELAEARTALARQQARIAAGAKRLEEDSAKGYRDRLKAAEKAISAVVAQLQADPSHKGVQAARKTVETLGTLAPAPEPFPNTPPQAPADVVVGDRVRVLSLGGQRGEVVELSSRHALVQIGTLSSRVPLDALERIGGPKKKQTPRLPAPLPSRQTPLEDAIRTHSNTLDLRGKRIDEAEQAVEQFLDAALLAHTDVVFVLHGHGTGALKQAVRREWLRTSPWVDRFAPAHPEQGGDAYTVAILSRS